jgi:hypothetical protein
MRKVLALGVLAAALAFPAMANEVEDYCRAYTTENDGDPSGCSCLGEAAAKDPALADALMAIDSPEALEAADESTKAAIDSCWAD